MTTGSSGFLGKATYGVGEFGKVRTLPAGTRYQVVQFRNVKPCVGTVAVLARDPQFELEAAAAAWCGEPTVKVDRDLWYIHPLALAGAAPQQGSRELTPNATYRVSFHRLIGKTWQRDEMWPALDVETTTFFSGWDKVADRIERYVRERLGRGFAITTSVDREKRVVTILSEGDPVANAFVLRVESCATCGREIRSLGWAEKQWQDELNNVAAGWEWADWHEHQPRPKVDWPSRDRTEDPIAIGQRVRLLNDSRAKLLWDRGGYSASVAADAEGVVTGYELLDRDGFLTTDGIQEVRGYPGIAAYEVTTLVYRGSDLVSAWAYVTADAMRTLDESERWLRPHDAEVERRLRQIEVESRNPLPPVRVRGPKTWGDKPARPARRGGGESR